jgi:spermidine/putrescine transport system substrate-binding protein
MKRRHFFAGLAGLAGCARDVRPRLNVYNWSAYVAPETIPTFEAEFGVRVRYATYESNEEMLAKVMGGNSGWDVVFPTHNRIEPMRTNGLLAPLRHEWLPGLAHLDARFRAPAWDAALQWGVPYMWSGTGIVFNRGVQPPPARWADLWSPRLKGRLTMLDDPEDMLGACLKKLGLPFSATDAAQLARAEQEAIAQKPLLRAYLNAEVRDQLVAGDVLAAQLWSTTAQQAIDAAPLRLSGGGLSALLRLRRHSAREPPRPRGSPIRGLPAAPRCVGEDCGVHAHRHGERVGTGVAAGVRPPHGESLSAAGDLRPR